ncbi:sensor histidine kinase [Marinobacterium jannaschii]|uniref:sensor histidine kinase n=1 Tax=Marinobacterium jannaschii TaxID=64970 RepID=UPI000686FBB5|nr:CHASE domain-containing protein [Marinobacterium jannaschii]
MRTIREYFDSFSGGWTNAKGGPLIVLLLCMLVTLGGWYYTQNSVHQAASGRFETNRLLVESQIKNRMAAYEQILRGGQGLFTAFPELTRDAWKQYVDALKLDQNFPGIQGVGFSQYIKPEELDQHVSQVRKEGFPEYRVKPEGERDAYTAILFLEPFDERNRQAFGYDMFSQETRRAAMESARDTGRAALSGRVELVQEITEDKQAGFLLYLPLYSTATKPATVELRREKLLGYVYSPFRATNLMRGILQEESSIVSFRLYDGDTPSEASLLYDGDQELHLTQASQEPLYKTVSTISIAGRPWTIEFRSTPLFESRLDFTLPMSLLVAGLIFSTMTFIISWMLVTTRNHATKLTEQAEQLSDVNKALEQSKLDAEQASRAKSAFLAAMSHEIRTPMNGVVGMVEILAHSELSSQQLDAVHTIRESSFSLLDLIDDVLDFSKIEAGRLELERVPVTVEEIVEGICTSLKSVAVSQGVSLSVFVSPDVPVQIWSDRTRLRQILYNLIGNAVKFSGGQSACVGRVDVQCTMSSGSPDTPAAEFIEFSVIDNGIGIAEETIQTLFTTFTQAETSTTRRFGGTGLGLAIAKRLVTLMGGGDMG